MLYPLSARTIVDMSGKEVEIPEKITKIFATSPPATYMIYTLDPLVLVGLNFDHKQGHNESSSFLSTYFTSLPVLGGLQGGGNSINKETLLSLHPDVVVSWNTNTSENFAHFLQQSARIPLLDVDLESLESLPKAYRFFGKLLGQENRAEVLAQYAVSALEKTRQQVQKEATKRPIVYYAEGVDGLSTECDTSFHYQTIKFAGGIDPHLCTQTSGKGMEKVSLEQVLLYNPDIIIAQEKDFVQAVQNDTRWNAIAAVKNHRVYLVPKAPFNWVDRPPSFMRLLGIQWLTHLFYNVPDEKTFQEEMKLFYRLFLHVDLSNEQIAAIVGTK